MAKWLAIKMAIWQLNHMTTNWTTQSGAKVEVTAKAEYELNSQGRRKLSGEKVVVLTAKVNGKDHSTIGGIKPIKHPVCVAQLGQIGLTAENLAAINEATKAVEAEIAEHNAACLAHAAELNAAGSGDINQFKGA